MDERAQHERGLGDGENGVYFLFFSRFLPLSWGLWLSFIFLSEDEISLFHVFCIHDALLSPVSLRYIPIVEISIVCSAWCMHLSMRTAMRIQCDVLM